MPGLLHLAALLPTYQVGDGAVFTLETESVPELDLACRIFFWIGEIQGALLVLMYMYKERTTQGLVRFQLRHGLPDVAK